MLFVTFLVTLTLEQVTERKLGCYVQEGKT